MKNSICLIISLLITYSLSAGIYCPPDITIDCTDNIHNTDITGEASTGGQYYGMTPKYDDWGTIGQCSSGTILRKWYVDLNWNDKLDQYEPFCTQYITVEYDSEPIQIIWPEDISLSCEDDIPYTYPHITHGPCDMVGWSSKDIEFTIGNGVCDKIIRRFTVIDWCTYDYGSEGIWIYEQKIFFADEHAPTIKTCEDITLSTIDCKGVFTVSNSAVDTGYCHNENIAWHVTIDLYSDGSIDYEYGTHFYGDNHIPYTKNCDTVTITLPENVGIGWHQVTWKISDNCGNPDYCSQMVTMKDTKPPTPICYNNLSTVLMPGSGMVELNANTIMKEAYDNCSWPEWIKYSFSPDPEDVTKVFTCDDFGIQNVRVYAIDHYGNYDFCQVTILFDDHSNTCPDMLDYAAEVMRYDGSPLEGVEFEFMDFHDELANYAMSDEQGYFEFKDTELSLHLSLHPHKMASADDITVLDLLALKNYILGKTDFNPLEQYLADINKDEQVGIEDLMLLRNKIMFHEDSAFEFAEYISSKDRYDFYSSWDLRDMVDVDTYYAFVLGDIAQSQNKGEHALINSRSNPFNWLKEGSVYNLYAQSDLCLDALMVDLGTDQYYNLIQTQFTQTYDGNQKLLLLNDDCVEINEGDLIFSFSSQSMIKDINITVANSDDQLEQKIDLTLRHVDTEPNVLMNQNNLSIQFNDEGVYSVNVYDLNGRLLNAQDELKGGSQINTSNYNAGLYMVQIISKSEDIVYSYKYFKE